MRATTIPRFGEPDVLQVADVAIPEPGPGQVACANASRSSARWRLTRLIESGGSTGKVVLAV